MKKIKKFNTVYLSGWYGYQNSGDDALLLLMTEMIRSVPVDIRIFIRTLKSAMLPSLSDCVQVKYSSHWFKGQVFLNTIFDIINSDVLVFGGGSTISDADQKRINGLHSMHRLCSVARCKGVPIIFSALGLGPLNTPEGRIIAKKILNMAELVDVRDSYSKKLCQELNISSQWVQGFDPAVLLTDYFDSPYATYSNSSKPSIGISLSQSPGTISGRDNNFACRIDCVVDAMKKLSKSNDSQNLI